MEVDDLLPDLAVVCEVHVPAQRSSSLLANCAWLVVCLFSASASPRDAALYFELFTAIRTQWENSYGSIGI